jgi:L-2-hydroxyglutarate oxidase LhgO
VNAAANKNWDALILGAGVSGLVTAKLLQKQGASKVALIDEYSHLAAIISHAT